MAIDGITNNPNAYPNNLDRIGGLPTIQQAEHKAIHDGIHFTLANFTTLADENVYDIFITTPNSNEVNHFTAAIEATSQMEMYLFEASSFDPSSASLLTPYNNNRTSSNTSINSIMGATMHVGSASLTTTGTQIFAQSKGLAGATPATANQLGITDRNHEWILNKGKTYCVRLHSKDADNVVSWQFDWYEYAPIYPV